MQGGLFKHIDGGFYRVLHLARHCDDLSELVVYEHLWPFDPGVWVRPRDEFERRFSPTTESEWLKARSTPQKEAQDTVSRNKALRRAQEKEVTHVR